MMIGKCSRNVKILHESSSRATVGYFFLGEDWRQGWQHVQVWVCCGMMTPRQIFMAALKREPVPRPAVGSATSIVTTDLMDEVGVGFPRAHLEPRAMAELAAAGHELLGYDNVMPLFSVWHESAALGCEVDWGDAGRMPDSSGRVFAEMKSPLEVPDDWLDRAPCQVPLQALRYLRQRFDDQVAVVGKVFGPWTLGYHLYGVEELLMATLLSPDDVRRALRGLIDITVAFGKAQLAAGADALTLADHCTRDLCSPNAYRDFLLPIHTELQERLDCPLILHICGDTSDRIPMIAQTGIGCFHYDSKVPARRARELARERLSLMGGTNNLQVLRRGNRVEIAADVAEKLECGTDILGPECAVPLDAPWRGLRLLAELGKGMVTR